MAAAQQTATYVYDLNGRPVETVGSTNSTTTIRNANGREVPIQKVDEKVISDDGTDTRGRTHRAPILDRRKARAAGEDADRAAQDGQTGV